METAGSASGRDTDVLIVGAGPTGLALATPLMRSGVVPLIVDKLTTGQHTSRAAVIHAHTLEVLERLGISERLGDKALRLATFSLRDTAIGFWCDCTSTLPTRYHYPLMLPQDMTEKILAERLAEGGGAVRWDCTAEALNETPDDVRVPVVSAAETFPA